MKRTLTKVVALLAAGLITAPASAREASKEEAACLSEMRGRMPEDGWLSNAATVRPILGRGLTCGSHRVKLAIA